MCNKLERIIIDNINRIAVGIMASSGMIMGGIQPWEIPCILSLIQWLTLQEVGNMAESIYDKIKLTVHKITETADRELEDVA